MVWSVLPEVAGCDVAEKGQKRKTDKKEHVSNTGKIYALVHHTCSKKKNAEAAADITENGVLIWQSSSTHLSTIWHRMPQEFVNL